MDWKYPACEGRVAELGFFSKDGPDEGDRFQYRALIYE
jgi:hypothetical protein